MISIKRLSDTTINRIAAGEVVERPASVIKELVENAIDAEASEISITVEAAGKNLIVISDNGKGMTKEELELAVQRHTTSKLDEADITNITSFGFRGEALPSIASISKLAITTKSIQQNTDYAYKIEIHGGQLIKLEPASHNFGTKIEVKDLFFATPARLKFLRNDKTELAACLEVIKKLALVHPAVSFSFTAEGKEVFKAIIHQDIKLRLANILGSAFIENSAILDFEREHFKISGFVSIPTYNRSASNDQYLYVNNRAIKDKLISTAARIAYQDYLAKDRHPVIVLFIDTLPQLVDVNVHPAKAEVRFRDSNEVRNMLICAIKNALAANSLQVNSSLTQSFIDKQALLLKPPLPSRIASNDTQKYAQQPLSPVVHSKPCSTEINKSGSTFVYENQQPYKSVGAHLESTIDVPATDTNKLSNFTPASSMQQTYTEQKTSNTLPTISSVPMHPNPISHSLGTACAQLHDTYILSQVDDGIVIVDQHAAHERLVYEQIKISLTQMNIPSQRLIMPVVVNLPDEHRAELLASFTETLHKFGLSFKKFGQSTIVVNEVPALLGDFNVSKLIQDLADDIRELGEHVALQELIEHVTETYACHHSIRAGRKMNVSEMNDLLRTMENTPFSAQCNHGRPTYIKLKLQDIEKLFGRR